MSLIVGFIFAKVLERFKSKQIKENYDPLKQYYGGFDFNLFKKAVIITAPAIILHELGHKFVAMSFGATATFHAAYGWLMFGALLAALNTGIIFFVPAYVSIPTIALTSLQFSAVAFAGPAVNAIIWGISAYVLKNNMVNKKYLGIVYLTKQINMFLFVFNMLPIPGFDGFKVYGGLFQAFL